jgi:hypothetical protein
MHWSEDDDEQEFEWKDEDEEEVPGEGSALTRINRVATIVFLGLLGLGTVYVGWRLVGAFARYFG